MPPSSTHPTPTNNVIVIQGETYVLVPAKTFSKIEKMTDELPALRAENVSLKNEKANSDAIISKQAELIGLKDKTIEANEKALAASERATEAEKNANAANEKALAMSQARVAELEKKVKSANKRTLIASIAAAALFILR